MVINQQSFLKITAALFLTASVFSVHAQGKSETSATAEADILAEVRENYKSAKVPPRLIPLAPGAVKPDGWLRDWALAAAKGITGQLGDRHDVFKYGWTGKDYEAVGEAGIGLRWPLEQSAYWLDGLVRLSHILDDPKLKELAHDRLDIVVNGVNEGGETFIWWAPKDVLKVKGGDEEYDEFTRNFNNWAHAHMGRALVGYYRATGDPQILKALTKVYADFPMPPLAKDEFRPHGAATNLDPMLDTYALSGDKRVLENAIEYASGESFQELIHEWATEDLPDGHTVLYYEHARVPAVSYSWTGNDEALKASRRLLELGLEQHGLPVGMASGQEHLMGTGAVRGLETCTVAASAWTYKWMLQLTGERSFADQVEQIFLNAGPAAISRDFDTLCYFQSMNRIDGVVPVHTIENVADFSFHKTAGRVLCCVANATRMLPDYIQHMWMATLDGGLAATLYGPSSVSTFTGDGVAVEIDSKTNYPFNSDIAMTVSPEKPVIFPLYLRIPGWCDDPLVKVNNKIVSAKPDSDGFVMVKREWAAGDSISLHFPMDVVIEHGKTTPVPDIAYYKKPIRATPITKAKKFGQPFASVHYGPLLFALPQRDESPDKASEAGKWQYAIDVKEGEANDVVNVQRTDVPADFHWQLDAPIKLKVPARNFDWNPTYLHPLPDEPVEGGENETITLVPYGTTKFRISMFPITKQAAGGETELSSKAPAKGN